MESSDTGYGAWTCREKGLKLTYTTDTQTDGLYQGKCERILILFICEGMYGEKKKQQKQ